MGFQDGNEFYRFVVPSLLPPYRTLVNRTQDMDAAGPTITESTTLYDFSALDIDKNTVPLNQFENQVVLVVNVASF